MSYDWRIWDLAGAQEPADFEEAGRMMQAREKQRGSTNPKFAALADKMVTAHPEADWVGDPRKEARDLDDFPVWGFALPHDGNNEILPSIIESAKGLGLVVYDDQAGTHFLPSGKILMIEKLKNSLVSWKPNSAEKKTFTQYFGDLLKKYGFVSAR